MFKKLKDKIEEEFKQAPLKFPVSVQQLAQVISPSQSVNSLSDNNASSSSLTYPTDMSNVSTDFFSIGGEDDTQDGFTKTPLTLHNVDLTATSPSNMTQGMSRSRRSSLSSVTSEASSLFPIYEGGLNQSFFQSDLESEMEDGMSGQIEKISKEQLYQSFKKILNRYNKYKGKYTELMKHYKELQHDNFKTKNVLQESQDKALRRMAELREQCQLEQKAKAHLEESLRNDVEERDHIIDTLKTKISLLSNEPDSGQLIDLESDQMITQNHSQSKELWHLKSQNEDLQKEIEKLKKIKETACHLIHRCDTTINEATEDVQSDNLKQKMSELKSEIQKMKSENESLSHLLSRNIIIDEDRKSQTSMENSFVADFPSLDSSHGDQKMDEKDKKIEKLNNLLLKCKEKINGLNAEIKAKNMIIEDNNKKIKELKDEVGACKIREEENALSVAENKKAIHEELNAKEEQIKALTKELKTKENEYIKEKADVIKSYEDKIKDMTADFTKEMKIKTEQNQKLLDDLKAKEIVSGSLDKLKLMEESFAAMLEFVKSRNNAFEELTRSKTIQIEKAHEKLEQKLTKARENLMEIIQKSKKVTTVEDVVVEQKAFETRSEFKNASLEASENFHVVEKLKSDVINLSKKLELLELELEESRKQSKSDREERDKCREQCASLEEERDKIKKDFQDKLNENAELDKALTDQNEKIKKVENEKKLLQKVSHEKVETESKLRDYIENYNKLEKENRTLQNDLVEKCGKLLKELNENKEKVKSLESEGKAKANELEKLKDSNKSLEDQNEQIKNEVEKLRTELAENQIELEKIKVSASEIEKTKIELKSLGEKFKELELELERKEQTVKDLENELERVRKEISHEKGSHEGIRNELDALRNNLKSELKEKEEKSVLVDKLTHECNLLLAEIENLKKSHGATEKKLKNELDAARKESATIEKLQEDLDKMKKENDEKSSEAQALGLKCQTLTKEIENLKENQHLELNSEKAKLQQELHDSEKTRQELTDRVAEVTKEKNETLGELQVKMSEIEALKQSLKSLRDEFLEREKSFEAEKARLVSDSENKLNILKNEIKFINTKHEEDIGNFETNLNSEMKEVSEKMVIAEKTSAELLEKLEKITTERDELKISEEEKILKISELEGCMLALKAELDEKFNDGVKEEEEIKNKHSEEIKQIVMQYDKEISERDEEIEGLKSKLQDAEPDEEINNRHTEEIKQIIIQYDAEIGQRDKEIESLKSKLSDGEDDLERLKSTKEELKTLRRELADKDNLLEERLEEIQKLKQDCENKILNDRIETQDAVEEKNVQIQLQREKFENEISKLRLDYEAEMEKTKREVAEQERKKWERKLQEVRQQYQKDSKEWNSQRRNFNTEKSIADDEGLEEVELECTSKVAVAALETGSGSIELLQKQLIQQAAEMKEIKKQHKREIIELKKASASKRKSRRNSSEVDWYSGGGLENDTEHEYLRNILYEYMMGKEQLVLAKVLSAIVKFNEEQTHNVLEKEQQRQTLLGQLGLI